MYSYHYVEMSSSRRRGNYTFCVEMYSYLDVEVDIHFFVKSSTRKDGEYILVMNDRYD